MNLLVLRAESRDCHCTFLAHDRVALRAVVPGYRGGAEDAAHLPSLLRKVSTKLPRRPAAIAVHMVFGGAVFRGPALYGEASRRELEKLAPQAPMHLPAQLALLDSCERVFPGTPLAMVFETSFFTRLPSREYLCGVPSDLSRRLHLRRYGLHGLFHETACRQALADLRRDGQQGRPRMLSICLEPKPEIAAVVGRHPVMVTGGVSPLEGIPGQTTCGDMDPGIVLALAEKLGWGPEEINNVLTQESGLYGLTGRRTSVAEILGGQDPRDELARQVLRYRMLQACGAGIAAMGGLDVLVFSGRYAASGPSVAQWLLSRLPGPVARNMGRQDPVVVERDLDSIVADQAAMAVYADTEEANAAGVPKGAVCRLESIQERSGMELH